MANRAARGSRGRYAPATDTRLSTTAAHLDNLASVTATLSSNDNADILVGNPDTVQGITIKPTKNFRGRRRGSMFFPGQVAQILTGSLTDIQLLKAGFGRVPAELSRPAKSLYTSLIKLSERIAGFP
jgi:hypothetical protein